MRFIPINPEDAQMINLMHSRKQALTKERDDLKALLNVKLGQLQEVDEMLKVLMSKSMPKAPEAQVLTAVPEVTQAPNTDVVSPAPEVKPQES